MTSKHTTGLTAPPRVGEVYLHQNGLAYTVIALAKDQDREELLVIHQGADGQVWSRTIGNFMALKGNAPRFTRHQAADNSEGGTHD